MKKIILNEYKIKKYNKKIFDVFNLIILLIYFYNELYK